MFKNTEILRLDPNSCRYSFGQKKDLPKPQKQLLDKIETPSHTQVIPAKAVAIQEKLDKTPKRRRPAYLNQKHVRSAVRVSPVSVFVQFSEIASKRLFGPESNQSLITTRERSNGVILARERRRNLRVLRENQEYRYDPIAITTSIDGIDFRS